MSSFAALKVGQQRCNHAAHVTQTLLLNKPYAFGQFLARVQMLFSVVHVLLGQNEDGRCGRMRVPQTRRYSLAMQRVQRHPARDGHGQHAAPVRAARRLAMHGAARPRTHNHNSCRACRASTLRC